MATTATRREVQSRSNADKGIQGLAGTPPHGRKASARHDSVDVSAMKDQDKAAHGTKQTPLRIDVSDDEDSMEVDKHEEDDSNSGLAGPHSQHKASTRQGTTSATPGPCTTPGAALPDLGALNLQSPQPAAANPTTPGLQGPPAPLTDPQHAINYLTQRCVSCRGPAVSDMRVRPALQQLQEQLVAALTSTVVDATSTSLLILGDPGSGKTLLVERSLAAVCAAHNLAGSARVVGVVRLSGIMHSEERVAFQDVARQLCSEFGQEFSKAASFEENLSFLRTMLATLHMHCKSVVFVLDAFERFARARGKQQLLYNLLDVLQHSKVQAAVIGVTCAQDVMDSMEKRVRSRFSHRRMILTSLKHMEVPPATSEGGPSTAAAAAVVRRPADASGGEQEVVTYADTPCGILQDILTLPPPAPASSSSSQQGPAGQHACSAVFVQQHNAAVASAVNNEKVKVLLRQLFIMGLKPRTLVAAARSTLDAWDASCSSSSTTSGSTITASHVVAGVAAQMPAPQVASVCDLSVLQLYLVIAMVRLENKGQLQYNFEMVWDECQSYRDSKGVLAAFHQAGAWRAFEELVAINLAYWISPTAEAAGRNMRYAGASLSISHAELQEGLKQHEQCPNELRRFLHLEA